MSEMPPLIRKPHPVLRNGQAIDGMVCTYCRKRIRPVRISGTLTEVGCAWCGRTWVLSGGQAAPVSGPRRRV